MIDPISSFLGMASENANAEVRKLLLPVTELAQRTRTAVVLISHLRKSDGSSLHRIIGSIAFAAMARSAFVVQMVAGSAGQERRLVPVKNNLGGARTAIRFRVEPHPEYPQPCIVWGDEEPHEGIEMPSIPQGRPRALAAEVVVRIDALVASGPVTLGDIRELVKDVAPSENTLRRLVAERYQWLDEQRGREKLIGLRESEEDAA